MSKLKTVHREEAAERDAELVTRELDGMRAELTTAQSAFEVLREQRRAALLVGSIEEVASFDGKFARGDARVDIATARIAALEAELESLQMADDGAERESNYERAERLAGEARELIEGGYRRHAIAVGAVLGRLGEISREVGTLNDRLPPGVARIDIEEFRGFSRSLGDVVRLPAVIADEVDFWPPRRAPQRADVNEIYARY